ncbi:hypothetical protein C8J56DRAFT_1022645 [Mycena floridula]|nr:hypothetical protein C8J56DRAFT_1022645 [Mycena floridula]
MVKSTAFALLLAVASLNIASTLAVPVRISRDMVPAQRRDLDNSLTELARRAPTKSGAAPTPKTNPVNTQNGSKPKAPGSNQKSNPSIPKGKPAPRTPLKPAPKPAAPYDKNQLLRQEFSLEQARIGIQKQEQAWKPTLLSKESERRAPGGAKGLSAPIIKAPGGRIPQKPTPQTTKSTPNKKIPGPSTGIPKPGKPAPNTQKPASNTQRSAPNTQKPASNIPKPAPEPGMTKPASTVDQNALLRQEFALEQSRIGLEKQEQAWKPTLLRRSLEESEIEELVARAPAGTAKSSTPKTPLRKPTTHSTKSTTPSTKGTGATAAKKEMPKDWYSNQYFAEQEKIEELSQRLKKNTNSHADLAAQFKTEQENIKAMQEEFKWKPKTWSG